MKLTDTRIIEFWEWCGFKIVYIKGSFAIKEHWEIIADCGDTIWDGFKLEDSIDLNNLFKYAVPKLKELNIYNIRLESLVNFPNVYLARIEANLNPDVYPKGGCNDKDPALALFWVIYEVMK